MASEIEKKKNAPESPAQKSKGLNVFLWLLVVIILVAAAVGNIYFQDQFATPVRVVAIVVLLIISLGLAAITNQGQKAVVFLKDSRSELRRITWPSRQEAMQTTLMVIGVTVLVSLILWGLDSIIVGVIKFLTSWRF